jgi:hypothetical protein
LAVGCSFGDMALKPSHQALDPIGLPSGYVGLGQIWSKQGGKEPRDRVADLRLA